MEFKLYWFAYYNGIRRDGHLKAHHVRDGAPFAEIMAALSKRGHEFQDMILNFPPHAGEQTGEPCEVDDSFLGPDAMIVLPTRPPMDDRKHADKVHSQPGDTTLERTLFEIFDRYFDVNARSHIRLMPEVVDFLPPEYANRADITFKQVKDACYSVCRRLDCTGVERFKPGPKRPTAAYLLRLDDLPELRGASLLAAFGMAGTETLVWAYRLRHDFSQLLEHRGLTMVEMSGPKPQRPTNLSFANDWKLEVVLQVPPL